MLIENILALSLAVTIPLDSHKPGIVSLHTVFRNCFGRLAKHALQKNIMMELLSLRQAIL